MVHRITPLQFLGQGVRVVRAADLVHHGQLVAAPHRDDCRHVANVEVNAYPQRLTTEVSHAGHHMLGAVEAVIDLARI